MEKHWKSPHPQIKWYQPDLDTLWRMEDEMGVAATSVGMNAFSHVHSVRFAGKLPFISLKVLNLQDLWALDLSGCGLTGLPPEIGGLRVHSLNLSNNHLTSLPKTFASMPNLNWLDLSHNPLGQLPDPICKLARICDLNLSNCELTDLPPSFTNLTRLLNLNLSQNQFRRFPLVLLERQYLEMIDLSENLIEQMPETCPRQIQIRTLKLSKNRLQSVPGWLGNLIRLQLLDLSNNQLETLPAALASGPVPFRLVLQGNPIRSLPPELRRMARLISPVHDGEPVILEDTTHVSWPDFLLTTCEIPDLLRLIERMVDLFLKDPEHGASTMPWIDSALTRSSAEQHAAITEMLRLLNAWQRGLLPLADLESASHRIHARAEELNRIHASEEPAYYTRAYYNWCFPEKVYQLAVQLEKQNRLGATRVFNEIMSLACRGATCNIDDGFNMAQETIANEINAQIRRWMLELL